MKIELKQLSINMGQKEYDMLQGIIDGENGFSNPAYKLADSDYRKWLEKENNYSQGKNLPNGWVPATTYFLYIDEIPVGYGRIRHSSSDYLENVVGAGNLGYAISKQYRGKGYGNILFKELLNKCEEFGYSEIKLFPYKNNEATVKIMLKNGGKIIGEFKEEKYIILISIK